MKTYIIKVDYSVKLEYRDYEEFVAALGTLIAGGLREFDITVKEEEA